MVKNIYIIWDIGCDVKWYGIIDKVVFEIEMRFCVDTGWKCSNDYKRCSRDHHLLFVNLFFCFVSST